MIWAIVNLVVQLVTLPHHAEPAKAPWIGESIETQAHPNSEAFMYGPGEIETEKFEATR